MPGFRYHRPETLEHALELLGRGDEGTHILAGGQSLIPMISLGLAQPRALVDLNDLPGLDYARCTDNLVAIGPLARHRAFEYASPDMARAAPLLPLAARFIGHSAIRNRGTFLGSLAHADPAAEWPAVALALDAELVVASVRGERTLRAADLFIGPLTTVLEPGELLREARLAVAPARTGASVQELVYRHGDYAVVGVVAQLSRAEDGTLTRAHLGLLSAGSTPLRAEVAERMLVGAGPQAFADAAGAAQEAADPTSDVTASANYRREMIGVLVRRALEEAYARAA
jgi:carbon-monoxide dehydrogenase medium subunit